MKNFFQFLSEASQSQAAMQAQKLGLVSDGHGGWKDKKGEYVAKTEKGKLKFFNQRQVAGQKDPDQVRTPANQQVAATQVKAPTPPPAAKRPEPQELEPQEKGGDGALTVVFGRFNPPTIGHEKLLNSASKVAAGGMFKIYPSRTQDPKKNPLNPDTKISFMRKMFPKYGEQIVNDENMKTIFDVLVRANEEGYSVVNIVVGSDRQAEFENLANKYNGDLYEFDEINVVSAGVRDADAEGVSGMSASKMRKAAAEDDLRSFRQGIPQTLDDAETERLFKAIKSAMKLKENYQLWQIAPECDMRNLRENYVRGKIFKLGDRVENLNTGIVGEVMRRGTNYLICVTEDGSMFKSWIKDIMEYTEVKMERKKRVPGKPNTLIGTGGYFKYATDMTPGFEKGDKTNLQYGAKPYNGYKQSSIKEFLNKYKAKKVSTY